MYTVLLSNLGKWDLFFDTFLYKQTSVAVSIEQRYKMLVLIWDYCCWNWSGKLRLCELTRFRESCLWKLTSLLSLNYLKKCAFFTFVWVCTIDNFSQCLFVYVPTQRLIIRDFTVHPSAVSIVKGGWANISQYLIRRNVFIRSYFWFILHLHRCTTDFP